MAKPKLALIPSAQGDKFYSVLPSNGDGDSRFGRNTDATRINSQGLIETVSSNVSRLNYSLIDGEVVGCPSHLLEPTRTNLIQYSEDFSNSYWTKSGVSVTSGFISPNGINNAFKLVEDTSTNHQMYKAISGTSKTLSFFAKSDGRDWIAINCGSLTYFNVSLGIVGTVASGSSATIESMPNGWFKCSVTETSAVYGADFSLSKDGTTNAYDGDGTSGVLLWGAMLEVGSYPTSYIPNYGTALGVTRSYDNLVNFSPNYWQNQGGIPYINAQGVSSDPNMFNGTEGVLFLEMKPSALDGVKKLITLSSGYIDDRIIIGYNTNNTFIASVYNNGLWQSVLGGQTQFIGNRDIGEFNKIAISYKENEFKLFTNGTKEREDTSGTVFNANTLRILRFSGVGALNKFTGEIKQMQYFDTALTDAQLISLTS